MDTGQARALRQLLEGQEVAALGTLHDGEPFVSMVPYALLPGAGIFVIHVSALASHTRDMERHDGVSLLVMEERSPEVPAQALPRVTVQGRALRCPPEDARHAAAREAYLSRFPASQEMFGFGDFSLFLVEPRSVRFVAGFGRAHSVLPPEFARILSGGA